MKRPATVVSLSNIETWTDSRHQLGADLRRAVRRGEIAVAGEWRPVPGLPGWYSVRVQRLKAPAGPVRRAAPWVAGTGLGLGFLVGLVWALLPAVLSGLAILAAGAAVLGIVVAVIRSHRGGITVVQTVNIRK